MEHSLVESIPGGEARASRSILRGARALLPRGDTLATEDWARRHRLLLGLLLLHALLVPLLGAVAGRSLWYGVFPGALAPAALALAAVAVGPRRKPASALVALGLLSSSALIVHLSGGYVEAHFHFFVVLGVLALYEDWLPFLLGLGYVFLHHGIVGVASPGSVYNHAAAQADPWLWAVVHGAAVAAFGALSVAAWKLNEDLRAARERAVDEIEGSRLALEIANEELRALDAMKSEFVALASHELRTPLTSILGFASTLLHRWDDTGNEGKREFVSVIEREARRLKRLVGELLDLSRVESGKLQVHPERFDLAELVEEVVASRPDGAAAQGPVGVHAFADRDHVEGALLNLLENAARHGEPPVVVDWVERESSVELRVRDRGRGVDPEFVPRLFDRFSRSPESVGGEQGAGLGLAIVQGFARANGGDAWYESPPEGGACFVLRLPRWPGRPGGRLPWVGAGVAQG